LLRYAHFLEIICVITKEYVDFTLCFMKIVILFLHYKDNDFF